MCINSAAVEGRDGQPAAFQIANNAVCELFRIGFHDCDRTQKFARVFFKKTPHAFRPKHRGENAVVGVEAEKPEGKGGVDAFSFDHSGLLNAKGMAFNG